MGLLLLLTVLTIVSAARASIVCPDEFISLPGLLKCYKKLGKTYYYDDAFSQCTVEAPHGRLATVETWKEHQAIRTYFKNNPRLGDPPCTGSYWIGAERFNRQDCHSPFFWRKRIGNITLPEPMIFSAFGEGEPNCDPLHLGCVSYAINLDFRWNEESCNYKFCPICEAPPVSII